MKTANIKATLIDFMGSDLSVVNAARVSFDKESSWDNDGMGHCVLSDKDAKLIKFLAREKHHSPFNHAFLTFRVKAPLFVSAQLVKHKFMPWNQVSRRYVDDEPEFYFPEHWRAKAENVKQGSSDERCDVAYEQDDLVQMSVVDWAEAHVADSLIHYRQLMNAGVCPEQARMVLPQNTMTEWYWSGTLGAFLDMLVLRLDNHTQKETREVAKLIANEVKIAFPQSYAAYLGEDK